MKIIIGLVLGFLLNGIVVCAKENINIDSFQRLRYVSLGMLETTKIKAPEAEYRIFIYRGSYGAGITAVKIK